MSTQGEPESSETTRSVVIERIFPHPPAKLWRALTERPLLAQWLIKNDFEPTIGHSFQFRLEPMPKWDGVIDCKVLIVDPLKQLSYTWSALGLDSVVLFTLTPAENGTHLRILQSGFHPNQKAAYQGAAYGWQRYLGNLEQILTGDSI